jgi:F-type H+-transporting ATPase subunit epsilon
MSQNLTLEVVTPSKVILETEAEYVTIPGELGELGILPSHIPLLTNLQSGVLSYKKSGVEKKDCGSFRLCGSLSG